MYTCAEVIFVKDKNICKFISDVNSEKLEIQSFIYETNPEIMKIKTHLSSHRAILVAKGEGNFVFDGKEFPFEKGSLVFGFEGESFEANAQNPCEYMYIAFSGLRSMALFRRFGISKAFRSFDSFDGVMPLWYDSLARASEENIDLATESILLYTFSRLTNTQTDKSNLINRIIELTEKQFTNPLLSVSTIAKDLTYNSKYISHIFKEKMGMSYTEYLRTLRLKYAVSLLDHGLDSVKNVALLSGFSDPLYFSSVFKKTIGVSPKEYQQRSKN